MKKLSVIIPYYKETARELFPALASVNTQVGIDFGEIEVILVNDGAGNELPKKFLKVFHNLDPQVILAKENRGPGVARQTGIDAARGEYVIFIDADDLLHNVGVLGAFLQEMAHAPDVILSPWISEMRNPHTGDYMYDTRDNENTWMHGKAFRRQYLKDNNIRFHPELRVHEDSYFLAVALALAGNVRKITAGVSYLWRYNGASMTRSNDGLYAYKNAPDFIRAVDLSFQRLEKDAPEQLRYKVVQVILYNYFAMHTPEWLAADKREYLERAERTFAQMIKKYLTYYDEAPEEFVRAVYNEERAKTFAQGIEAETFAVWFGRILGDRRQ